MADRISSMDADLIAEKATPSGHLNRIVFDLMTNGEIVSISMLNFLKSILKSIMVEQLVTLLN